MTWSTTQPGSPRERRDGLRRSEQRRHRRPSIATSPPSIAAGDQRNDREVDGRRHEREPPERRQHVGQRRRLRGQRDPEALGQPAGHPAAGDVREPRAERVRPRQQAGRRHDREPEPGIGDEPGSASSRSAAASPSAAGARPARPLSRARRTTPAITAARTTDDEAPAATT